MTAAAGRTEPPARERPTLLELGLFAVALAVSGLVLLALVWSGTGPYEDMARANGATSVTFSSPSGAPVRLALPDIVELHRA